MDGSTPTVATTPQNSRDSAWHDTAPLDVADKVLALGSLSYGTCTTKKPREDFEDEDSFEQSLKADDFPDVNGFLQRPIILNCSTADILSALATIRVIDFSSNTSGT